MTSLPPGCRAFALVGLLALASAARGGETDDLFELQIRPLLLQACAGCHGADRSSGGLRVDSRAALVQGGDSGPAIVPGSPDESLLLRAARRAPDVASMPPDAEQAVRPDQLAALGAWIAAGAPWPDGAGRLPSDRHWAFEPVGPRPPSAAAPAASEENLIDRLLRNPEAEAAAAPLADRRTLIRRVAFDLTGLPPTPEEVEAFCADPAADDDAWSRVVERLLASPAYGERWGRHWLDVVRYADTAGETADYPVPTAWRYRNYVIDAFNADKPYDQFVREQIAGDILARQQPVARYAEQVTATGFLALARRFGFDSENYHHLTLQDTIDTLGQAVLGLSLGCARCHDHKFDPISTADYYALYGIFASSRYPFPGSEQKQRVRALASLVPPEAARPEWRRFQFRLATLAGRIDSADPPPTPATLHALDDIDGDFELQAPAAGGSHGVLAPPWQCEGVVAVTTDAQSSHRAFFPAGRVGVRVEAQAGAYRIRQALHLPAADRGAELHVALDFRLERVDGRPTAPHRFALRDRQGRRVVEVLLEPEAVRLAGEASSQLVAHGAAGAWQHLELRIDVARGLVEGRCGAPGALVEFGPLPLVVAADRLPATLEIGCDAEEGSAQPAACFDNVAVQTAPFDAGPRAAAAAAPADSADALRSRIEALAGPDGDLELQPEQGPLAAPWNLGPASVARLAAEAQSPWTNHYPPGRMGLRFPAGAADDGAGWRLPPAQADDAGRRHAGFDFRCIPRPGGGDGSWRYCLGHGPGTSTALELGFDGAALYRREGAERVRVAPLAAGQWSQLQVTLDPSARTYAGRLAGADGAVEFSGRLAEGWDGVVDYAFIDSHGHVPGERPALDVDNFVWRGAALRPLDAAPEPSDQAAWEDRRRQVADLRRRLAEATRQADDAADQWRRLLAEGPVELAYAMAEGTPHDACIQQRGEPSQPGARVRRGFPAALGGGPLPDAATGSGRLELAVWLTRPEHPLTARVMVNRLWQHHFGRGIVATPNDFGARGQPPSHPELLDALARAFVDSGWSVKAMHRLMLSSRVWRQRAAAADGGDAADASRRDCGFRRRRLSAEEIRDAILAVAEELDRTPGAGHPFPPPHAWSYTQHAPFADVYDHRQRSVYLMVPRLRRHPLLALFDGPDPNASTARRVGTTVPTQALFFLNAPLVHEASERWAARQLGRGAAEGDSIERLWRGAFARPPEAEERAEAEEFLRRYRAAAPGADDRAQRAQALAALFRTAVGSNEFVHVE